MELRASTILNAFVFVVAIAVAPTAHAIDKCKVKIDSKTGVISVSATGVSGTLLWGSAAGSENQAFFNPACVTGDTAKGCQLADPATLASKTPPVGCTIYLDDAGSPCSVWIKGCSPGQRAEAPRSALAWVDANGNTVGAANDEGSQLIRDDGIVIARIAMAGGTGFLNAGAMYYNSVDCTGPGLVFGSNSTIRDTVVLDPNGPVYYAPDGGTVQTAGSQLQTSPIVVSPIDCMMFFATPNFVPPHGCCTFLGGSAPLSTPATVDFTGVTFPLSYKIQ
jgi:hypothetical protein